jgi:hypothetical protein
MINTTNGYLWMLRFDGTAHTPDSARNWLAVTENSDLTEIIHNGLVLSVDSIGECQIFDTGKEGKFYAWRIRRNPAFATDTNTESLVIIKSLDFDIVKNFANTWLLKSFQMLGEVRINNISFPVNEAQE